jgi:hypothetical protein
MEVRNTTLTLPLDALRWNPVQPEDRTTNDALKHLEDQIRQSGEVIPLAVVGNPDGTYTIADGHRRFTVAQRLGFTMLPCTVLRDESPENAFVRLNLPMRAITGKNWLTIYAKNPDAIKGFTPKTRSNIETLKAWIGQRELIRIGLEGKQAPSVVSYVVRILGVLNAYPSTANQITGGQAFWWLTDHSQQRVIIESLKRGGVTQAQAMRLFRAIRQNKPLA